MTISESLIDAWKTNEVKIIKSAQPFSLNIDHFAAQNKSHHAWYFKKYQDYFYDAHADLQLKLHNLPDVLRMRLTKFNSTTALNSNYGKLLDAKRSDYVFPVMDEDSDLFCGLFKFSKAFLLENYVINQDQAVADLIFQKICQFHNLNSDEWVFQSSLHKNTSLFHLHFRMYQVRGTPKSHLRKVNFTPLCLKYVKDEIEKYFLTIQKANNTRNQIDFKLQQAYVRFAQETSLKMDLVSEMFDLALADETTFNDAFKQWIINYSAINRKPSAELTIFDHKVQQACQNLLVKKEQELKNQLNKKEIKSSEYNTEMQKWVNELKNVRETFFQSWLQRWIFFVAKKLINLWTMKVEDVCADYENAIKTGQNYHTLKKSDRNATYLDFCQISQFARKRFHKGVLYLTSMYLFDDKNMRFDDNFLNKALNDLEDVSALKNVSAFLSEMKSQHAELDWKTMNDLILKTGW